MPIYEYQCKKCDAVVEAIQKMSDPPLSRHAGCGGKLERIMSLTSFQLKGEGWYVTDYKKSGGKTEGGEPKGDNAAEAKAGAAAGDKADAKLESKTGGKTDTKSSPASKSSKKKEKAA